MTTETRRRLIDVEWTMDGFYEQVYEDESIGDPCQDLTYMVIGSVESDALSRIDYNSALTYPDLTRPADEARNRMREECKASGHAQCVSLDRLLKVVAEMFADCLIKGFEQKRLVAKYDFWPYEMLYADSDTAPNESVAPRPEQQCNPSVDSPFLLATPNVEMARDAMVDRMVEVGGYDRDEVGAWFDLAVADAENRMRAKLSAGDDGRASGQFGLWDVSLEWLSRAFALVWQREIRTLPLKT